jgi:adenine-specific DNA methylase
MLFETRTKFDYHFPQPQYLGAKAGLLSWIYEFIPLNTKVALDAFGGSQSVAFLFKQMGFETITNDFLSFNHQIGLSLIENSNQTLNRDDLDLLFSSNPKKQSLIEDNFEGVFFETTENQFLDNIRANVGLLDNKYKQALALSLINRSLTRKITMGHFAHTQALAYAKNPIRIARNPNLIRSIKSIFLSLLDKYNCAVFDNTKPNRSYNQNILDLLPKLKNIDLVYFDPPYTNSHSDYQAFYHFLETFTQYWCNKQFINQTKRYYPYKFSGFDKKTDVLQSFEQLFEMSDKIPNWLISWNDRSYPSVDELVKMISKYKQVEIKTKTYQNSRGGKGSVKGSMEILLVCHPK